MKQVTEDDALVGLLSAVILQAMDDYRALQKRGMIGQSGELFPHRFSRLGRSRSYSHCDGMRHEDEGRALVEFLSGWGLDLLCDHTGNKACRIRKALGVERRMS